MATVKKDHVGLLLRTGFGYARRLIVKTGGVPMDLSGASARLDIKHEATDDEALFSFSSDLTDPSEGGLLTLNAVPGAIDFAATAEATATVTLTMPSERAVHDFQLILPGQEPLCLFSGFAVLVKGITV